MADWEGCRWDGKRGHYESWFLRANHPSRPLAFWIRYTVFAPKGAPEKADGELWAVWFDGERGKTVTGKIELPMRECAFAPAGLDVRVGEARLTPGKLEGAAGALKWKLGWSGGGPVSLTYPEWAYPHALPKAKVMCVTPNAHFAGELEVAGEKHAIDGWVGSHNHNWGSQHSDSYAWVQVCGFDGAPEVFLECGVGRVAIAGPVLTPQLGVLVLNLEGRRLELNALRTLATVKAEYGGLHLRFASSDAKLSIGVAVEAARERFVALRYRNPPGGAKVCLNSKLAGCTLRLTEGGQTRVFTTASRAAFEIVCEESDPRLAQVGGFSA